jgi:3-oxoacyl-[acyl-carrier protein] reductase
MGVGVVVGSSAHGLPAAIALGLRDSGWDSFVVTEQDADLSDAASLAPAVADHGDVTLLVDAFVPPQALTGAEFLGVGDAAWEEAVEQPLLVALACLQAAHAVMHDRGGSVVALVPAVAVSGAAGFAPLTTATEGVRMLARSAARQWGTDGVSVTCLAVSLEALHGSPAPGFDADRLSLAGPALGHGGDARRDLGPAIALLGTAAGRFLTGATVGADGGLVMAP